MTLNTTYGQLQTTQVETISNTLDTMLSEENWELISKTQTRKVYRKYNTVYDMIEITESNTGKYRVTVPMRTSTYAYTTAVDSSDKLFFYISDFIEHYDHYCPENS